MATTFIFEELDEATREYLTAVRDNEGVGSPGVFASTSDSLPGCGCIVGPLIIGATLLFTLMPWLGIILHEPLGVACLQTGGILLGGWLLMARFRTRGGSNAGTWVYADPLHLYEAFREQVTVTPIDDVSDASYTHNYDSNGNYQNSVISIAYGKRGLTTVTLTNEARSEYLVTYLNYLAWARGPDGGERGELPPADLGGLARYVVRNGDEPKDAENNINLSLIELDITEVPEEPEREGRAAPPLLPYVFMFVGALLCFFVMGVIVNPVVRDNTIFDTVMKDNPPPSMTEPRFLRAYLTDPRNKLHRDAVTRRLAQFYAPAITHVETRAENKLLGRGMAEMLKGLGTAEQPVVSLRVSETATPPGAGAKEGREERIRTEFANAVNTAFANESWGKAIQPPPGEVFTPESQPPPIGHQLIAFVEPPDPDANGNPKPVHFDIAYALKDAGNGLFTIVVNVTLKADVTQDDVGRGQFTLPGTYGLTDFETRAVPAIRDTLIRQMIGPPGNPGIPGMLRAP
ncbi:hypothetical protein R5W24_000200 [Gemmata sp. JC717]|uniref:hypothetical protein n=1 Tax=Gemmata algarum TaxID=2975278 RepID=UPI0021BA8EF4|nr:hypothetical protein [Gemmata algarum]MDY3551126.1 hypothetical protein [Gemmata algarum]